MKLYDTLIIGSGYFSVGYALSRGNSLICEEHQICDVGFYLPMRAFSYKHYEPKTAEGRSLFNLFDSLSLFGGREQNVNRFEFAFCKYILDCPVELLLKCRVVSAEKGEDGIYDVTLQTNAGLTGVRAREILNTTSSGTDKRHTTLFVSDEAGAQEVANVFSGSFVEKAFYKDRYALHLPVGIEDENEIKARVYEKWVSSGIKAKLLYMAPVFYSEDSQSKACDYSYGNPIEAFEAGFFLGKEQEK